MSDEQRAHIRHEVQWEVQVRAAAWAEVLTLAASSASCGGLFVRCAHPPHVGTALQVAVTLPDGNRVSLDGEVIRTVEPGDSSGEQQGFGMRFAAQRASDLLLLESMASAFGCAAHDRSQRELKATVIARETIIEESTLECSHSEGAMPAPAPRAAPSRKTPSLTGVPAVQYYADTPSAELKALTAVNVKENEENEGAAPSATAEPLTRPASAAPASENAGDSEIYIEVGFDEEQTLPKRPATLERVADEALAFGIDFGTTYCSIGLVHDGQVRVLEDEDGQALIPSVVSYPDQGPPTVGWPARELLLTYPSTTFLSPKRLIGRSFDDPQIQPYLAATAVRTSRGPQGQVLADLYGQPITLVQVCADIFRHVAALAARRAGRPVRQIALAAPVGFGESQRQAIVRAVQLAGLGVAGIIDEPVAAAMAGELDGSGAELVAVYDFGGGTFDFTLLRAAQESFEVIGEAGDPWLGGDDFDLALANYAADQFWKASKLDLRKRQVEWQRLIFLCERAKRQLSLQPQTVIEAPGIALSLRGGVDLKVGLTRARLAELCGGLVTRSIEVVETCLSLMDITPKQIDRVIMTGGVSRIPLVRERVQEFFGREIPLGVDPEQAVVIGTASFAQQTAGQYQHTNG